MSVGDFSTVVASYVFISLWSSLMTWSFMWHLWHLFASVCSLGFIELYVLPKNYKTILSIIPMFLTSVSSTSFASPPIPWSSAIYKNLSYNFCFILYDFVIFVWGMAIVVRSGSIWFAVYIGHIDLIYKSAGGACFRDPGPAGKSNPGGL